MVDTIKLSLPNGQYELGGTVHLRYIAARGIRKYVRNPTAQELASGIYLPNITLIQRQTSAGWVETMSIEFSAPKLVFGNNFDELKDSSFESVIMKLLAALDYMQIKTTARYIREAKVTGWHPSKNIIFSDYFGCSVVISALHKVDVSRVYNLSKTDFSEGEILHIHCNSKDIAFYDKLADLRRGRVSDKRSLEKQNKLQTALIDRLSNSKQQSVLRFEIRFNGVRSIKRAIATHTSAAPTLTTLFNSDLSQSVLLTHWYWLTKSLDYLALDAAKPLEVLQSYLSEHPGSRPHKALAGAMCVLVVTQTSARALRQVLDANFGRHTWARLKPLMQPVAAHRHHHIRHVEHALKQFDPTRVDTLLG